MVYLLIYNDDSLCIYRICLDGDQISRLLSTISMLYREKLYEYNSVIKKTGYYLKPLHIVVKKYGSGIKTYYYYGKYWYRVVSQGSKIKWYYISSVKPLQDLPDPPINPLILIKVINNDNRDCLCILEDYRDFLEIVLDYLRKASAFLGKNSKVLPNSLQNSLNKEVLRY
jgi:hypothetical protein